MSRTRVRILIRLRPEILDPEGKAVAGAIVRSGFPAPLAARVGKMIELELAGDRPAVEPVVHQICDQLLVNAVIQEYELEWL